MAVEEFWTSVRTAASLMVPKAAVDSPRLDRDRIERILQGATFWLTPGAIKGYYPYDPKEFKFLSEEERQRLEEAVKKFKAVAESVPKKAPATDQQISEGVKEFRKILEVVRPDKYADFDAFVIGKKIEKHVRDELPQWVREMVFETGYDASGAPALWIWVEVEDEAAREKAIDENYLLISGTLRGAATQICPDRWAYIRMRTVSEQRPKTERRTKARSNKK